MKFKPVFILCAILFAANIVHGQGIMVMKPYLQNPSPTGITVMWRTAEPAYSWVEYGTDESNLKKAQDVYFGIVKANNTDNKIRIKGLEPGKKYVYRVCSQEIVSFGAYKKEFGKINYSPFYSFTTLDTKGDSFTAVIFNDLHSKLPTFDLLVDKLKGIDYDFVVFNGDCFHDPKSEENELEILKHYSEKLDGAEKPLFYLRGNHETRGTYSRGWPSLFDWDGGNPYFAFSFGDTRFVLLDNGEDKKDNHIEYSGLADYADFRLQETEWLKTEIASKEFKNAKRKILIHHMPIYSWENRYEPGFIACKDLWDPIFQKTPFAIGITGHLHRYNFYKKGDVGNPFPLVVGGGNNEKDATVMVLTKKGNNLTLKVIKAEGEPDTYNL